MRVVVTVESESEGVYLGYISKGPPSTPPCHSLSDPARKFLPRELPWYEIYEHPPGEDPLGEDPLGEDPPGAAGVGHVGKAVLSGTFQLGRRCVGSGGRRVVALARGTPPSPEKLARKTNASLDLK